MKLSAHLQQLSQHIGDVVPQPAHTSQIKARSVERAVGASHGTTGWVCKAAGDAAHLVRLPSARGAVHREIVGAVQGKFCNQCLKGLIHQAFLRKRVLRWERIMKLPATLAPDGDCSASLRVRRHEVIFSEWRKPLRVPYLETAASFDDIVALAIRDPTLDAYSAKLWPSAYAAAAVVLQELGAHNGAVVEVGCGCGLPSLTALKAGAPAVIALDWSRWALALVQHAANTFQPSRAERLRTRQFDILDPDAPLPASRYLVAADFCYEEATAEALGALVARHIFEGQSVSPFQYVLRDMIKEEDGCVPEETLRK